MRSLALCTAALGLLALTGCPDNSGGAPPDGTELEEFSPAGGDAGGLLCDLFRDDAFLIHDFAEAQAFFADECSDSSQAAQDEIGAIANDLDDGEALVIVSVQLGGCLGEWGVHGFFLSEDEATVTAWVLRADSSYGRPRAACPANIGGEVQAWRVSGAATATAAEIAVGEYNPDRPGAPAQPG